MKVGFLNLIYFSLGVISILFLLPGNVYAEELCSPGENTLCSDLGASWGDGIATCRVDGSGYDVTACGRSPLDNLVEMVKPARRDAFRFENARCNDDTNFGFDLRLAPEGSLHPNTWIVILEGGGGCDDYSVACKSREGLSSTTPGEDDRELHQSNLFEGVLSNIASENPEFFDANQVLARYCSNDAWSGSLTFAKPTSAGDWYFSGSHNVSSLFNTLKQRYGLEDSSPDTEVLFAGTSSGASGVLTNAFVVKKELLPSAGSSGRIKLILDGGWLPEWDNPDFRFGNARGSDLSVMNRMYSFWKAKVDQDCLLKYSRDKGKCLLFKYGYPFLTRANGLGLKVLIQNSSKDENATYLHHIPWIEGNQTLEDWKALVLSEFEIEPVEWIFSSDQKYHTVLNNDSSRPDAGWCRKEATTGERFCDMVNRFWNDDYSGVERAITP